MTLKQLQNPIYQTTTEEQGAGPQTGHTKEVDPTYEQIIGSHNCREISHKGGRNGANRERMPKGSLAVIEQACN